MAGFSLRGRMNYSKPPLDFTQQTQLLLSRGLQANPADLQAFLEQVNYYRLSGYLYPYRKINSDDFIDGTSFHDILSIYNFDSKLRHLTFSAIEKIEISILRTQLVKNFSFYAGPFCYTQINNYTNIPVQKFRLLQTHITESVTRSNEKFVESYKKKYTSEKYLPFWMVAEVLSMSQLSKIFQYAPNQVIFPISRQYNLHSDILRSWLHVLTVIRNKSAHHNRLWNIGLGIKPRLPNRKYHPEFYSPYIINNSSFQSILAIMHYLLKIIHPSNSLISDFKKILLEHPEVSLSNLGLPTDWETSPLL